jgi:hypothetical protein
MTKLASTAWGSVLLGLAFSGAAVAQTAPNDDMNTTNDDGVSDADTDMSPSSQSSTTVTPPADVDVNVYNNVPPAPPATDTTDTTSYMAPTAIETDDDDDGLLSGIGIAIAAGGGTGGFVNDTLRESTNIGGDWDVRATIGTRSPIAFEGSYIGSAQSIDALCLDTDALLVGNGLQGALRVNATLDFPVQPFAFGGAAWRRYDLTNADTNLSDVAGSDDVLEFPVGIGVAGRWNALMVDVRGEYRFATENDLLPVSADGSDFAGMDRWGAKATVGVEF